MVSVGGLASGLDTNGIINQLLELERRPIQALEQDIAELQQVQATFTGLSSRFADLRSAGSNLTRSNLDQPTVTQSDDAAASVSADSSAVPGTHTLEVTQLATANRIVSQGFVDADSTPVATGPGTFAVQVGDAGASISVAVTASTTLADLASAINAADGDVTASIVNDGTNDLENRLVLTSSVTGQGNDIQVTTNGTDLDFANNIIEAASADDGNAGTYTGAVTSSGTYTGTENKTFLVEVMTGGAAGAARYRVSEDGGVTWDDNGGAGYVAATGASTLGSNTEGVEIAFSAGGTLAEGDRFYVDVSTPTITEARDAVFAIDGITQTRSSNTVDGALAGVTIDLSSTTGTPMTFSVAEDDEAIVTAVQGLVDAYNGLFSAIREQQSFDTETLEAGLLLGDRTANAILSQLRNTISRTVSNTGSDFDSLASLGITSSRTGGLELDTANLRDALATDREGVVALLASTETSSRADLGVVARPSDVEDGEYTVNVTTAPEVARVQAGSAMTDTLSAAETLNFSYSANNTEATPTTSNFSVTLQAGDSLSQVVDRLNSAFATQGVRLTAFAESNTLTIESTEHGADMFFSVESLTASGAGTTRIGTGTLSDAGVDVAGTIGGATATGQGDRLEVQGGDLDGLAVNYTGSDAGLVGTVTLVTGVGTSFVNTVNALNTGSESVVGARTASIQDQIDEIEDRIADKQDQVARTQARLEEEFANLEVQLAGLNSQADFLTNQLAQLGAPRGGGLAGLGGAG